MITNYITTTFQNILRCKGFLLLNMPGLSIGLATSALILLYVRDKLSYQCVRAAIVNTTNSLQYL